MFKISLSLKGFILSKPIMLISPNQFGPLIFNAQELTKNIKFEYIFGNISFILLFIAVLLYWFDLSNNKPASKQLKSFCMLGSNFALTILLMIRWWESGHFPLSNLYESLIGLSWGFTAVHLIITLDQTNTITERFRYKVSPLTKSLQQENENFLKAAAVSPSFQSCEPKESQYNIVNIQESLGYPTENNNTPEVSAGTFTLPLATQKKDTALSTLLSNRGIKKTTMNRSVGEIQHSSLETSSKLEVQIEKSLQPLNDKIGTITAPAALLISVFATFFLPPDMLRATTLIPALKSNWLTMHVTLMVLSYAFLLIGSLLSIAFCAYQFSLSKMNFKNKFSYLGSIKLLPQLRDNTNNIAYTKQPDCTKVALSSNVTNPLKFSSDTNLQSEICSWLNTTSYRILGLGFPLLTIGILSGAVWANEAWGSYWSWDPKETWALITWLVFAIYFHSRYNRSSDSSIVPASIASVGFVVIWICYLGVNLLGTGLHSYGWFQGVN